MDHFLAFATGFDEATSKITMCLYSYKRDSDQSPYVAAHVGHTEFKIWWFWFSPESLQAKINKLQSKMLAEYKAKRKTKELIHDACRKISQEEYVIQDSKTENFIKKVMSEKKRPNLRPVK